MSDIKIIIYIVVMAITTYLIRMIPITLFKKKIQNKYILSFLHYMPYAVLGAMTFPAILYATDNIYSSVIGMFTAIGLAYMQKNLITVALTSSLAVFLVEFIIKTF